MPYKVRAVPIPVYVDTFVIIEALRRSFAVRLTTTTGYLFRLSDRIISADELIKIFEKIAFKRLIPRCFFYWPCTMRILRWRVVDRTYVFSTVRRIRAHTLMSPPLSTTVAFLRDHGYREWSVFTIHVRRTVK